MKYLLMGLSLCSATVLAFAGQQVDETVKADSDGYVKIEHVNGKASIKGWNRDEVKVVGELSDRTDDFIFERRGNEVIIEVEVKRNRGGWNNWKDGEGDKLEIFVPKNSRVKYTATNADVDISEVLGGSDIETINGDIDADDLAGRIRMESVNGDIEGDSLLGNVNLTTVNGDIRDVSKSEKDAMYNSVNGDIEVNSRSTEFNAETVNGDMQLTLGDIEELSISTVNGSIEASMNLLKNGDVRANSVGGSIDLKFQSDVSARFDIQGHAGGRISNNLSDHEVQKAKYGPSRWLEFSLNGGDARVDVSTVSGRVRLNKR